MQHKKPTVSKRENANAALCQVEIRSGSPEVRSATAALIRGSLTMHGLEDVPNGVEVVEAPAENVTRDLGPAAPGVGDRWRIVLVGPQDEDEIADALAKNLRGFLGKRTALMERMKRAAQRELAKVGR